MSERNQFIPDHSLSAICESYDAALIRAGFYRLEAREMAQFKQEMHLAPDLESQQNEFTRRLRRSVRAHGARTLLGRCLPRAAQLAACLIAIIAIGAGVAIAASESARTWAAGVLLGSEKVKDKTEFSWGWEDDPLTGFAAGASIGDTAWLMDANNHILRRVDGTDAEPVLYQYSGTEDFEPLALETDGQNLYLISSVAQKRDDDNNPVGLRPLRVGRVVISDGSYALDTVYASSFEALFGMEGAGQRKCAYHASAFANGRLYLVLDCTKVRADAFTDDLRLIEIDPASGAASAHTIPEGGYDSGFWGHDVELFAGPENRLYISCYYQEKGEAGGFDGMRIFRLEDDYSYSAPSTLEHDGGFFFSSPVWQAETDTLFFLSGNCAYAAPDMDGSRAYVVAHSNENGQLLMLSGGCMIVNSKRAVICDLSQDVSDDIVLTISGCGWSDTIASEMNAEYSNLTFTRKKIPEDGAFDAAGVDIWGAGEEEYDQLIAAGRYTPLHSDILSDVVSRLSEDMKALCIRDRQIIGVPAGMSSVNSDISFNPSRLKQCGVDIDHLPETWGELLQLISELSHNEAAQKIPITSSYYGTKELTAAQGFARFLYKEMASCLIRTRLYQGREVDFGDADFRALMDQLAQIDFSAFRYAKDNNDWIDEADSLLNSGIEHSYSPDLPYRRNRTMKLTASDPIVSRGYVDILMIDPDCQHVDLATAFLERTVQDEDYDRESFFGEITSEEYDTPEIRAAYAEHTGRVWYRGHHLFSNRAFCDASLKLAAEYLNGKMDYDSFAQRMNALFAEN